MLVKDLIKMLQDKQDEYDRCFSKEAQENIIGPLDIQFEVYQYAGGGDYQFMGVSPNCTFGSTEDGVYTVLVARMND